MLESLNEFVSTAGIAALHPIYAFIHDGSSRFYWLYCITGIVMMFAWHRMRSGRVPGERSLFDREVWFGTSATNDYFILIIGSVLNFTILSWLFVNWKVVTGYVVSFFHAVGVSGTVNDSTAVGLGVALTLCLFVADDFVKWAMHTLMHRVPELWEFHKVHHSAEELNFVTAERHHPLEIIMTSFAAAVVYGTINGVFIAFFGDKMTVQSIFGANVFLVAFNIFGGVLRHSPVWISFGPRVERWVISPAMHQIHHSSDVRHFDKNMGGSLAVWDRLFGTLYIPSERDIPNFGIGEETKDFRSLGVIYFRPFQRAHELLQGRFRRATAQSAADTSASA